MGEVLAAVLVSGTFHCRASVLLHRQHDSNTSTPAPVSQLLLIGRRLLLLSPATRLLLVQVQVSVLLMLSHLYSCFRHVSESHYRMVSHQLSRMSQLFQRRHKLGIPPEGHSLLLLCRFHKFPSCCLQCISIARCTECRSGHVAKGIVSRTPEKWMATWFVRRKIE